MIAHLAHHSGGITGIITSPDQVFFATSSEDSQVMVWDSAKLERSVSAKPRLVYTMDAPITTLCRIENTHCLATGAEDGQLHILRVHVSTSGGSTKYSRIECIRTWRAEERDGHVVSVSHLHGESRWHQG
jgi:phosphoinositide-3-kinase regulatory subunit 4